MKLLGKVTWIGGGGQSAAGGFLCSRLFGLSAIPGGLIKFKASGFGVCVEVNTPQRRGVRQANQLLEHLNQPPVTLLHHKHIHSPSFHTIMHLTEGPASAATVEEIYSI